MTLDIRHSAAIQDPKSLVSHLGPSGTPCAPSPGLPPSPVPAGTCRRGLSLRPIRRSRTGLRDCSVSRYSHPAGRVGRTIVLKMQQCHGAGGGISMRILMTSYEFPPIGGGGAAVVAGLCRELVTKGHEVDLVTMRFQNNPITKTSVGCRCTACPAGDGRSTSAPRPKRSRMSPPPFRSSRAVVPQTIRPYPFALHSSRRPPRVADSPVDRPAVCDHRARHRRPGIQSPSDASRASSPESALARDRQRQRKDHLAERGARTTGPRAGHRSREDMVIPNGLEVGEYTPYGTEPKVLVVTRMLERKGIQYLLASLAQSPINHEVNIVGEGPYLPELRRQAAETGAIGEVLGVAGESFASASRAVRVVHHLRLPLRSRELPDRAPRGDGGRPRHHHHLGHGLRRSGGRRRIAGAPKDPEAITRALRRLIHEPDLRRSLGTAARRRIEDNFTWSAVAGRYLDEYARHIRRPHDWAVGFRQTAGHRSREIPCCPTSSSPRTTESIWLTLLQPAPRVGGLISTRPAVGRA